MAPFFFWPILWLTLPVLLWSMAGQSASATGSFETPARAEPNAARGWRAIRDRVPVSIRHAAAAGWWFGFGYHLFGLFWIGEAFLVEAEIFAWLLPFAVTLLPAGLALFMSAASAVTVWFAPRADASRVVAFAVCLGMAEWLRGHIFTGLPWNVLGYALTSDMNLSLASVFGIYGLTLIAALVFTVPAIWAVEGRRWMAAVAILATLLTMLGANVLSRPPDRTAASGDEVRVRIVQPSVPQREKWRPENQRAIFDDHLALSLTDAAGKVDTADGIALIVWPEAAMPFFPLDQPVAMADIGLMLPPHATLISGALRADPPPPPGQRRRVFNSLLAFGRGAPNAALIATYDKTHLVPFGEYLPFQRLLEAIGLQQLTRMRGGFASGAEPRGLIDIPRVGLLAPLICYEAIFPARVIQSPRRPRAIVNVTNDGWFGNTTGPRQHLHMARVRAVEEGVPVIRAANNGISALIDAHGRIAVRLDLNVRGTIDARLPTAIAPPVYARWGDRLFWLGVLSLVIIAIWLRTPGQRA